MKEKERRAVWKRAVRYKPPINEVVRIFADYGDHPAPEMGVRMNFLAQDGNFRLQDTGVIEGGNRIFYCLVMIAMGERLFFSMML